MPKKYGVKEEKDLVVSHILNALLRALRAAKESRAFLDAAAQYRRTVNDGYAGPRLHAATRATQTWSRVSGRPTRTGATRCALLRRRDHGHPPA
jgi:hypothetical protein